VEKDGGIQVKETPKRKAKGSKKVQKESANAPPPQPPPPGDPPPFRVLYSLLGGDCLFLNGCGALSTCSAIYPCPWCIIYKKYFWDTTPVILGTPANARFRCTSQKKIRVFPGIRRVRHCRRYPYLSVCQVSKLSYSGIVIKNSGCKHHQQGVLGSVPYLAISQPNRACTRRMADS